MRLANVMHNGATELAVQTGDGLVLVSALERRTGARGLPRSVDEAIRDAEKLRRLQAAVAAAGGGIEEDVVPESAVQFAPCVQEPEKILCIGLNYRRHAEETGSPIPAVPIVFSKFRNALAGHAEDVPLPRAAHQVDYEGELAIVIGRRAVDVPKERALAHVFGYCVANDVSARDLQMRTSQWLLGKTCDRFAPIGPYLVTADEVANPNALAIRTFVNGETRQDSNTADMIFACDELIHYLSQHFALEPGDIILTGTPEGVILGYPEDRRVWLQDGDVVTVEIEGLGRLTNRMVRA